MKLFCATRKVQRTLEDDSMLERRHGQLAHTIRQKLMLLAAVENLEDAVAVQTLGIHPLTGNRKGQYAVKLDKNNRLIVIPCCEHGKPTTFDKANPSEIAAMIIHELAVDYH